MRGKNGRVAGTRLAYGIGMLLGRCLAYFAHPAAAWRRLPGGGRILLVSAYFGASYLLTFMALLVA